MVKGDGIEENILNHETHELRETLALSVMSYDIEFSAGLLDAWIIGKGPDLIDGNFQPGQ